MKQRVATGLLLAAICTAAGCRTTLSRDELIHECSPAGLMKNGWDRVILHYEGSGEAYHMFVMVQHFPSQRWIRVPTNSLKMPAEFRFEYGQGKLLTVGMIGETPVHIGRIDHDEKEISRLRKEGFAVIEAAANDGTSSTWVVFEDASYVTIP